MDVINKILANKLKKIGVKRHSELYYVKKDNISRLCTKTKINNYLVIKGLKISTTIKKTKNVRVTSAFTLSEINNILKYYDNFFKVHFDINKNIWKINKSIFKLYFLNSKRRKYIDEFIEISDKEYSNEVNAKGEILLFLIKSEFIDVNDINNI